MSVSDAQTKEFLEEISTKGVDLPAIEGTVAEYEAEGTVIDICKTALERNNCPVYMVGHLINEVRKNVLTPASLDACTLTDASSLTGESSSTAGAKPTASMARRLDRGKLSITVSTTLQKICKEWNDNSPLPAMAALDPKYIVSVHAIKNSRRKMEDRHECCVNVNQMFGLEGLPGHAYFAVFDGHAGVEAATYAKCHLLCNIVRYPIFTKDITKAISEGIVTTDKNFCTKAEEENLRSGTTAVVGLVTDSHIHMGWTGDSQILVVRKGVPAFTSQPHKPEREDERQRIESAGGCVMWMGSTWRVDGHLSVSRAIGDAENKPAITSEPDVVSIELDGTEDYVVLACDGIWDVIRPSKVPQLVYAHLTGGGSKESVAKSLIDHAKAEGSSDNMTAIVVFFDTFELKEPPQAVSESESSEDEDEDDDSDD